jgi:transcriptional regulator with XRE-family HTH domain
MTKPAERFAAWLRTAMPRAGLELEGQMAGGRATLADAVGVSRSTVKRWLDGDTLPEPTKFEAIANRLGVPVVEMLVETGIISIEAAGLKPKPKLTPQDAARALGVTDPDDIRMVVAMAERLRDLTAAQAEQGIHWPSSSPEE